MTTSTATELWTGWPLDDRAPLMAFIDDRNREKLICILAMQRSVLLYIGLMYTSWTPPNWCNFGTQHDIFYNKA